MNEAASANCVDVALGGKSVTDPDAAHITKILDAIPGAWERTREGLAEADRGEGTPLDELA